MIAKPSPQQRSLPACSVPFGLLNRRNVKKCQQMQKILKESSCGIGRCYVENITHLEGEEAV
ncbi:MAG: hypothetical protein EA001_14640 [Oscillatoriales cyanobacterium]|nr:MAG: hypothetical protein EA001_14640 [Oscillatoriales cyanobacterium]